MADIKVYSMDRKGTGILQFFTLICLPLAIAVTEPNTSPALNLASPQAEDVSIKLLKFEVATIKPVEPGTFRMMGVTVHPGGRVVI
jgi:hypothetical protein